MRRGPSFGRGLSFVDAVAVVACRVMLWSSECLRCHGTGRVEWDDVSIDCGSCDGKGRLNWWQRLKLWNDTHPRGSFPARAKCWLLRHDWKWMETFAYCSRCRAVWDAEWQEAQPPVRL